MVLGGPGADTPTTLQGRGPAPAQDVLGAATPVPATGHSKRGPRPEVRSQSRPPLHSTHQALPTLALAPAGHGALWGFGELPSKEGLNAAEGLVWRSPRPLSPHGRGSRAEERGATPQGEDSGVPGWSRQGQASQSSRLIRRVAKSSPPAARGQAPTLRHAGSAEGAERACFLSINQLPQFRNRLPLSQAKGSGQAGPPPGPTPSGKAICSASRCSCGAPTAPTVPLAHFQGPPPTGFLLRSGNRGSSVVRSISA